jgi:8-oxo-dGTP diphosphatase
MEPLPYKLATLCDLRDSTGRVLLLRRLRAPNQGLCSPIGGKLDMTTGESPAQCAQREIREEAGLEIPVERLHLMGMISEQAFEGRGHWLLFLYRVLGPVRVEPHDMPEGRLEWHEPEAIGALPLPETDRRVIWPLIHRHEARRHGDKPGFFAVHIDCRDGGLTWEVQESFAPGPARGDG